MSGLVSSRMDHREIAEVCRRVIEADRISRGLPPITDDDAESASLLALAKAARGPR